MHCHHSSDISGNILMQIKSQAQHFLSNICDPIKDKNHCQKLRLLFFVQQTGS